MIAKKKYAIFHPWITSRPAPAGPSGRPRSRSRPEDIRSSSGPTTAPPKNDPIYIKESEWVSEWVSEGGSEWVRERETERKKERMKERKKEREREREREKYSIYI